jgi:hypothetical protein
MQTDSWLDATPANGDIPNARCLLAGVALQKSRLVIWGGCGSGGHGPCPAQDTWLLDAQGGTLNAVSSIV